MKRFSVEAFNAYVYDEAYSADQMNDRLGQADQLAVQIVTDRVDSSDAELYASLEESNDGLHWRQRPGGLASEELNENETQVFSFTDLGITPFMALVRLKVSMTGDAKRAFIKAYICGRSG